MKLSTSRLRAALLTAGPLAVALAVGGLYLAGGRVVGTDNAYVKADKVALAPEVKGRIVSVDVAENQPVQAGAALFRLDDAPYRIALAKAEADLAEARHTVASLKGSYRQKIEEIALARANAALAAKEFERKSALIRTSAVSASSLDTARTELDVARQRIRVSEQELAQIASRLGGDPEVAVDQHPLTRAALATRDQAALDLDHTVMRAPFDGIASQVPKPGAWVDADSAVMALVSDRRIWIDANFKETDLTHVAAGQPVKIAVDTYPDSAWTGRIDSIAQASGAEFSVIPAQNTTGNWVKVVQRIPVRIAIDPAPGMPTLRAGMSVEVEVDTGHVRPLAAALFGAPAQAAEAATAK